MMIFDYQEMGKHESGLIFSVFSLGRVLVQAIKLNAAFLPLSQFSPMLIAYLLHQ